MTLLDAIGLLIAVPCLVIGAYHFGKSAAYREMERTLDRIKREHPYR